METEKLCFISYVSFVGVSGEKNAPLSVFSLKQKTLKMKILFIPWAWGNIAHLYVCKYT